jgi:alpha-tubulin suppressor-like RCC1 family protein
MKRNYLLILILVLSYSSFSQCFISVSSGYGHVAGKKSNGTIWVWGSGAYGQLGNLTDTDEYSPILLSNLNEWKLVKSSYINTFCIKNDKSLWGTGSNVFGGLGIGSTINYVSTLTQITNSFNWKDIAPGDYFTIGLKYDNTLWSWGQNDGYQLGLGICCSNVLTPTQIGTQNDWKMISSSYARAGFALKDNGTLWGWGSNPSGMLGPSNLSIRQVPTQLNSDMDWSIISAGESHILAIKNNGTLWGWGSGDYGETGDSLPVNYFRSTPTQVGIDHDWVTISTGIDISFAIKSNGSLWAWGKNDVGQLGDGTFVNKRQPVQIGTATNWNTVSAGWQHVVATKSDGSLWTWGSNDVGQLGNGTTVAYTTPTLLPIDGCVLSNETFTPAQPVLTVSPNPAQNELQIAYKGVSVVNSIVIYDLSGRVVYTTSPMASSTFSAILNISELQSGSYVVVLKNGEKKVVSKQLIKE